MRLFTGLAVLVLLAGVSACDSSTDGTGSDATTEPSPTTTSDETDSLVESRTEVRSATQDVLRLMVSPDGPLASARPGIAFANGTYTSCDDDSVTWSYNSQSRVDLTGQPSGLSLLGELRRALEAEGWMYDAKPVSSDPATSLTARKGLDLLRVRASQQPFLLVSVLGPCSEPSAAFAEQLSGQRRSEPLTVEQR